uniref:Uncharacterized protein n=1 Tax=Branchiostoma floridae TaxID=7739 RepID=C3Y871_BRAFL|eukprot:XP_002607530.1 hypothetical protein BRAFLDRAFT_106478 [Branchiostoma floridae]
MDVVSNKKLLTGAIADRLLIKETVRRVLPLLPVIDDHRARQLECKKITLNGRRRRYYETKKRNRSSVQCTPGNRTPQKFKSPDAGPVAGSSVQCTPGNRTPQKFKSPDAGPVAGSSVQYTPGNRTPQKFKSPDAGPVTGSRVQNIPGNRTPDSLTN